jgi:hypothetical protein
VERSQAVAGQTEAERSLRGQPHPSVPPTGGLQLPSLDSPVGTTHSGRSRPALAPARKLPRSREWIRTLGGWIMLIAALPAFASLVHPSLMRLFIPAFFVGLIVFLVGGSLESRRFNRPR